MNRVLREAERRYLEFLSECGRNVPALLDLDIDHCSYRDELIFTAHFTVGSKQWTFPKRDLRYYGEERFANDAMGMGYANAELRDLYYRCCEAHLIGLDIRAAQNRAMQLMALTVNQADMDRIRRDLDLEITTIRAWHRNGNNSPFGLLRRERDIMDRHQFQTIQPRDYNRQMVVTSNAMDATTWDVPEPPVALAEMTTALQSMMRSVELDIQSTIRGIDWGAAAAQLYADESGFAQYLIDPRNMLDPYPVKGAQARARQLLLDWLSPEQKLQFEADNHFDVVGVDTKTRYRIRWGCVQNVYEVEADGRLGMGWCFAPAGNLACGDVMLAQKIALETNENAALKVANPFGAVDATRMVRVRADDMLAEYYGGYRFVRLPSAASPSDAA